MTLLLKKHSNQPLHQSTIVQEIETHSAWHGHISGLEAQNLLIGEKKSYLFILRKGEFDGDYYVTFLASDLTIVHQPFAIWTTEEEEWYFKNLRKGGPFTTTSFDDVLHLIMHCGKLAPIPKVYISRAYDNKSS